MVVEIIGNLINSSIIKPGTELSVSYVPKNTFGLPSEITGTFKVARIIHDKGNYFFTLASLDNDKTIIANATQVNEIDGMTADRIIKAFNLTDEGKKKPRNRRKKIIINS